MKFVMEMGKMTFPDAIRYLGQRLGIEVTETARSAEEEEKKKSREALLAMIEYECRAFEEELKTTTEGQTEGLAYLRGRRYRDDIIATFRLGYSPKQGNAMITKAQAAGYPIARLEQAGLTTVDEYGSINDRFAGRVVMPIQNASGKVVAFSGRSIDADGAVEKYVSTPETELYKPEDLVYGIYQARNEMVKVGKCYLVEGYTDVISMYQAGVTNAVAAVGMELTVGQVRHIKSYAKDVTLMYDSDSEGVFAAMSAIDKILHEGMGVRVLMLPDGESADTFIQREGKENFEKYAEENECDFVTFEARVLAPYGGGVEQNRAALQKIVSSIAEVSDGIERELYVNRCSQLLGISDTIIYTELDRMS